MRRFGPPDMTGRSRICSRCWMASPWRSSAPSSRPFWIRRLSTSERADPSLEFWELFVSGRRHFWRSTADDVRQAEAFLGRALQIQPDDAPSLAILAHCKLYDVWVGGSADPSAAVTEAYRLALRAISVSGSDAFAHFTLGVVL